MDNYSKAFLGIGWNFPPGEDDGHTHLAEYEESIRQAIRIILMTNPGDRIMRADFGAGLNLFVFEPVNPTTLARLEQRTRDALIDWEPRIDVAAVSATTTDRIGEVLIAIEYRVRTSNAVRNFVYPFYMGEGSRR